MGVVGGLWVVFGLGKVGVGGLGPLRFLTPLYILNGWFGFETSPSEILRPHRVVCSGVIF